MAYVNPELLRGLPSFYDAKQNFQQKPQALSQELLNQPQNNLNVQNFKENYPLISPRDFRMQNQIFEQKLLYDNAQKAYANATDDAEKTKYRKVMEDTATNANLLRENAQRLGLNTTGFGADDSFGDAVQRMNYNRNRGTFDIMDMPSTTAQKREVLFDLVRQGTAPHVAREVAEMFHDKFREENIRKLNEGIMTYGLNPDGSLNDFGGMMLRKLAYESPVDAEHIAQSYAAPKDLFGVNAQINLANLNNQAAWDRELESLRNAQAIADAKLQQNDRQFMMNYDLNVTKLNLDIQKMNNDVEYRNAQLQQSERERWSKTPEGILDGWLRFGAVVGQAFGWTEQETNDFARMAVNKVMFGDKGSNNKDYEEIKGKIIGQFTRLETALANKDVAKAQEIWTGIDTLAGDVNFKNIGLLSQDDMKFIDEKLGIWKKVMEGKMTLEEAQKLMGGNNENSSVADFKKADEESTNNAEKAKQEQQRRDANAQKSAEIGNEYSEKGIYKVKNPAPYQNRFTSEQGKDYSGFYQPYPSANGSTIRRW